MIMVEKIDQNFANYFLNECFTLMTSLTGLIIVTALKCTFTGLLKKINELVHVEKLKNKAIHNGSIKHFVYYAVRLRGIYLLDKCEALIFYLSFLHQIV